MSFPHLFSPIDLGGCEVANRTVMAPINNGLLSVDETWPAITVRYYEERARGGIGLIVTGAVRVHGELAGTPKVGIFDDRFIPSHRKLADRIHRYDTKIFCQLTLNGGKVGREAPSAIYNPAYPNRPRELSTGEMDELVQAFIDAAGRAREAGYDGVELNGGHTYFIGACMSPSTNRRTDRYGGSFEGRMKFVTDVINGIHDRYEGFPVGVKFSAYEELPDGVDEELGVRIGRHLAGLKPAHLHVTATSTSLMIWSRYPSVPHMYAGRNSLVSLAGKIKAACPDTPVFGVGGIVVPDEAEAFIADGVCDMVALGRTVVADPHWARKAKEGRAATITPCIRCNVCYYQLWKSEPLICTMNPYVSKESEQHLQPTDRPKKVMIVGAGPGGIRCAITAAKRGHRVSLYEKQPYIGGMVYPGSRPAFKDELKLVLKWYETQLAESDVEVHLDTEVTPEMVEREAPDSLVVAVGGEEIVPPVSGIDKPHVVSALDVLRDVSAFAGAKNAVVIGGGEVGCETACHLADNGFGDVTMVEMLPSIMTGVHRITLVHMQMLLEERGISVMEGTSVNAIHDDYVEVRLDTGKLWGVDADLVVYATGMKVPGNFEAETGPAMKVKPKTGLVPSLSMKAEEVHVLGDCCNVARILEAHDEGEKVGRWL